jgi:predicted ATPase
MLIKSIRLENFLSFGPASERLHLAPLNVLIGSNGSGKSNFLEAFDVLRNAPGEIANPIRQGGGISDWLWKNEDGTASTATLEFVIDYPKGKGQQNLCYGLSFTAVGQRFQMIDEWVQEAEKRAEAYDDVYFYYRYNKSGHPVINALEGKQRSLKPEDVAVDKSILAQRRDPDQFPEITYLGTTLDKISLYREWNFGRYTAPRLPQKADLPNDVLLPDASNLGLALNRLRENPEAKRRLLDALRQLYEGIDDYGVRVEGGTVQVFFEEGRRIIPATRLSDGTLRHLSLLTILLHPDPPPLICIEEPELGLHPDILPTLAKLLQEASERTQVIVTTHSEMLVDSLTDTPEAVIVCEKTQEDGTSLQRLDPEQLKPWLEKYRLGDLWSKGQIGGVRW